MKSFKLISITIIGILSITVFSCKKKDNQLRDFYLEQSRDENLVGIFQLENNEPDNSGIVEWNIQPSGEIYQTSITDGVRYDKKTPLYYWYTNGNKLHLLFYSESWDKGSYEDTADYWFSDMKDTLFIQHESSPLEIFIKQ